MKRVFLFDMDGTLTPARKHAPDWMGNYLEQLSRYGKIGIVSGSGFDYIESQCSPLWTGMPSCKRKHITLLPCNGTQRYEWDGIGWVCKITNSIREEIGNENYQHLVRGIVFLQNKSLNDDEFLKDLDVIGNFISYRKSLINWCMIGRDAGDDEREAFVKADTERDIRKRLLEFLKDEVLNDISCNITATVGGNTSIDIYPKLWDKTYALSHFPGYDCWFVGDRCTGSGNDRTIYEALRESNSSFQTKGPIETIDIISRIIESLEE
jgi:phosphomannomutase